MAKEDTPVGVGERRAFIAVIVGLVLIQVGLLPMPPMLKLIVSASGLLLEVVGLLVWPILWLRRNRHDIGFSQRFIAAEMDRHYDQFHELVRWLRRFPREQREALLRYVTYRQKHLSYRVGALTGGFGQLALLPLLVARVLPRNHGRL